jgi:hypothetical protein
MAGMVYKTSPAPAAVNVKENLQRNDGSRAALKAGKTSSAVVGAELSSAEVCRKLSAPLAALWIHLLNI